MFLKLLLTHPVQTKLPYIIYIYITIFTILRAFPNYKAYMLGFGQVRKGSSRADHNTGHYVPYSLR